jgi:conjugative transfer signal peptidase TraF
MNLRRAGRIALRASLAAIAGVAVLAGSTYAAGGRLNISASIPLGLYWVTHAPVETGQYVMFCPPENRIFDDARARGYIEAGFCPGDFGHLMKKVLAAKGDVIAVTAKGVTVNGGLLPYSVPLLADGIGRPLPHQPDAPHTLGPSELLLMTDVSPTSFDARYFGPIARDQVTAVIRPIVTW